MTNVANWVEQQTTTTGTGPVTLSGSIPGSTTWVQAFGTGLTQVWYSIENGENREAGLGDFNGSTQVLTRSSVLATLVSGVYDNTTPTAITLTGTSIVRGTFNTGAFNVTLKQADVNDTPVNGATTNPISSNWAFDHTALTNPHNTTKTDVGLGNVDNTSDLDKPISTATQAALDTKGDVSGPASSVDNRLTLFNGATGKLIKQGGVLEADVVALPTNNQFAGLTQKLTPVGADTLLIEDSAATGEKKRVPWSSIPTGVTDLTDAEFPTYAVFDAVFAAGGAVNFADGNKQFVDAGVNPNITIAAPTGHPANFMLTIFNSPTLSTIAPAAGGSILWANGTPPTWAGRAELALYYDGTNWIGSALVGVA